MQIFTCELHEKAQVTSKAIKGEKYKIKTFIFLLQQKMSRFLQTIAIKY